MAAGGAVSDFCSGNQPHMRNCEYYADGGSIASDDHEHAVAGHIANSGLHGLLRMGKDQDLDKYYKSIKKGHKSIDDQVSQLINNERIARPEDRAKFRDAIEKWMESGGITNDLHEEISQRNSPQLLAEGGSVKKPASQLHGHPIEQSHPEQNIMLQATKGRVANYLNSLKPQEHVPKLAFDDAPDQSMQKKKYESALKLADHPMHIMHELSNGTVDQEHIGHMNAMYPEMNTALQKKITEKITQAQLDGKKPSHKIRQGLSLLMGTPLSGDLTPQGIQAAQATFAAKKSDPAPGPAPAPPKSSKSSLSKSDSSFLTGNQSLVKRSQKA